MRTLQKSLFTDSPTCVKMAKSEHNVLVDIQKCQLFLIYGQLLAQFFMIPGKAIVKTSHTFVLGVWVNSVLIYWFINTDNAMFTKLII